MLAQEMHYPTETEIEKMENITIQIDDSCFADEGHEFADWCESEGYAVRRVSDVDGLHPDLPEGLWDSYCNSGYAT